MRLPEGEVTSGRQEASRSRHPGRIPVFSCTAKKSKIRKAKKGLLEQPIRWKECKAK